MTPPQTLITMRALITIILCVIQLTLWSQNLVTNPSFEDYLDCPFSTAELDNQVVDWFSWQESPDFYHVCSNELDGFAGIPSNAVGIQFPITGSAYTGLVTYTHTDPEIREYMATPLAIPLVEGQEYYMMFFTSWYDGGVEIESLCATNHIGLRFFENPNFSESNPLEPDNFAHLDYSEVLTDSASWTLVEGWFTADQEYNWVALGNFFDGNNTNIEIYNSDNRCFGFYYIENVCIAQNPSFCQDLLAVPKAQDSDLGFMVFPNPTADFVNIQLKSVEIDHIEIVSQWGQILIEENDINDKEVSIDVSALSKGIYLARIQTIQNDFLTAKILIK
jgi:hypothetical protein